MTASSFMIDRSFLFHEDLRRSIGSHPVGKLPYDLSTAFSLEILVQVVKDSSSANQTFLIIFVSHRDPSYKPIYPCSFLPAKLRILEVDVMNNLSDRTKPGIRKPQSFKQNFEGATIPFVGKFGFIHVESDFSRLRLISFAGTDLNWASGSTNPRISHPPSIRSP